VCIQLSVGFVTTFVLLITTVVLMQRFPDVAHTGDTIGILPSMWMAYKNPQLQDQFLQVADPTVDNLRAMGMKEILQLAEE
jgi:hypothetical protein